MPKPNQTEEVKPIEARHKTLFPHGLQICLLLLLCINKKSTLHLFSLLLAELEAQCYPIYLEYIWLVFLTAVLDIRKLLDTFICVV